MLDIIFIITMALVFDFVNGFHDAANAIATVVSTRVLTPQKAVILAASFDFFAFLVFGLHVAKTIGIGIIDPSSINIAVIAAALIGAIIWNLITWYGGIPASSSHALVGGLVGASIAHTGFNVLILDGLFKIGGFIFLAPIVGMLLGFLGMTTITWFFKNWSFVNASRFFRILQLISAASYSLGHGANDAQKTIGIILVVLISNGIIDINLDVSDGIPIWIIVLCNTTMALGILFGGWRIVKTMGQKICDLQPVHGFAAETSGALCLYGATWLGVPVSTTHTIIGSIMGVGVTKGKHAVRWDIGRRIICAWFITIPMSAVIAVIPYLIFNFIGWGC